MRSLQEQNTVVVIFEDRNKSKYQVLYLFSFENLKLQNIRIRSRIDGHVRVTLDFCEKNKI